MVNPGKHRHPSTLPHSFREIVQHLVALQSDVVSMTTREGLSKAKELGKQTGRPRKPNENVKRAIEMYQSKRYSLADIREKTGISKTTCTGIWNNDDVPLYLSTRGFVPYERSSDIPKEYEDLRKTFHDRFIRYPDRHPALTWSTVEVKLTDDHLRALDWMEQTGGEPDVVVMPDGQWLYVDCAEQSNRTAQLMLPQRSTGKTEKNEPLGGAVATASEYGVAVLTEDHYRHLQTVGAFDLKT